jgi:hypothetical protein
MPFPAGLTLVTVACQFDTPPSGGASGTVRFTCQSTLVGATDDSIVAPFTVSATLDANGEASVQLPATNDPQWVPLDWSYAVYAVIGTATIRGTLQLDYLTASVQLADLIQVDGAATVGVTYATLAQLTTVSNTVTANVAAATAGIAAVSAGYVKATDHNLVGWTFDPAAIQAGTVLPTAGLANVARVRVLAGAVANIHFHFTAGGSSLTAGQCFAALYNDAGALLGGGAITGDQAANWATSGFKTCPLSVAQGVTPTAWYRVLWWFNVTTGPTLSRGSNADAATLNAGLSAPLLRYSSADTGRTNAASVPANIGAQTPTPAAWWVGLS